MDRVAAEKPFRSSRFCATLCRVFQDSAPSEKPYWRPALPAAGKRHYLLHARVGGRMPQGRSQCSFSRSLVEWKSERCRSRASWPSVVRRAPPSLARHRWRRRCRPVRRRGRAPTECSRFGPVCANDEFHRAFRVVREVCGGGLPAYGVCPAARVPGTDTPVVVCIPQLRAPSGRPLATLPDRRVRPDCIGRGKGDDARWRAPRLPGRPDRGRSVVRCQK